jgi:outer membrane protein
VSARAAAAPALAAALLGLGLSVGGALPAAAAEPTLPATLSLDAALAIARQHQPDLRQARANAEAAQARVDQARAGLLPQVAVNASYQRATSNFAPPLTQSTNSAAAGRSTFETFNYFNSGVSANQLLYDFGQTTGQRDAAQASADAQVRNQRAAALLADLNLRAAFYTASTARTAVEVARETLANQDRHLEQIQAFVDLGRSPPIDLLQAKVDQANADVQLINAQNDYATARAVLNQTMGVESPITYQVQPTVSAPIPGESSALEVLVDEAVAARPEIAALHDQMRAQELANRATWGKYWPTLGIRAGGTYVGQALDRLVWNLSAALNLSWVIYDGGAVRGLLREGSAKVAALSAQVDSLRLQVRVDVEQAQLAVTAAKAALNAAERSLTNARARLDLAEVRYRTGVGNGIELSDAQLAATNAAFQKLQAQLKLDTARAQLTKALART